MTVTGLFNLFTTMLYASLFLIFKIKLKALHSTSSNFPFPQVEITGLTSEQSIGFSQVLPLILSQTGQASTQNSNHEPPAPTPTYFMLLDFRHHAVSIPCFMVKSSYDSLSPLSFRKEQIVYPRGVRTKSDILQFTSLLWEDDPNK